MAYHTRERDPLFDTEMQRMVEKRSKELIGLTLMLAGLLLAVLMLSYSPDDPNWLVSTDAPVKNWLGRTGASIAAPLFMAMGWGGFALVVLLVTWGLRFTAHRGSDRVMDRIIFAPILLILGCAYAATLAPGHGWGHSFGLGGLFGDMISGSLLNILPFSIAISLKFLSFILFILMILTALAALGARRSEVAQASSRALLGAVLVYAGIAKCTQALSSGTSKSAARLLKPSPTPQGQNEEIAHKRTARVARSDRFETPISTPIENDDTAPASRGLLGRLPLLSRRETAAQDMPEPELVTPQGPNMDVAAPEDDRVRAKISDVVRLRRTQASVEPEPTNAPDYRDTTFLGRPEPLLATPGTKAGLRAEPPLYAGRTNTTRDAGSGAHETAEVSADLLDQMDIKEPILFDEEDDFVAEPDSLPIPEATSTIAEFFPSAPDKKVVQHPQVAKPKPSERARAEAQPSLQFDPEKAAIFELPPLGLLTSPSEVVRHHLSDEALEENARMLENVLDDYGVKGDIVSVRPGPVVTMYELEPAPGLKASRVVGLSDDIARSMSALSARVSTVPGRSVIGIELPNENREKVVLREILSTRNFGDGVQKLPLALGKDISGAPVVTDLAKMPHLLIAGTTGSGKSVAINTMILSLLYKLTPDECRLIMIDPKMLELSVYDGIPHLLSPVVTDPKKAVVALKWVVGEMEERYRRMSKMGVRNIDGHNSRVADALSRGEMFERTVQTGFDDETGDPIFETEEIVPESIPYIVVIVDEMADLMMVAGKEIEACIQRLAQMARASGIHLIMATQRPSVDVITGTIKANFPTRISFQVTSKIDSRTILGEMGAEQLLGMGDMLYMAGGARITRCHGPFVSDEEVEEIVNHLKSFGAPSYVGGVIEGPDETKADSIDQVLGLGGNGDGEDALYDQAVAIVIKDRKCSTSYIQRKLAIGYNKAARLVEQMEDEGLVSQANHVGKREILVPEQQ